LSIAASYGGTPDCYQIVPMDDGNVISPKPTFNQKIANDGTKNFALCVSQQYNEVVLLDDQGTRLFVWNFLTSGHLRIKVLDTPQKPNRLSRQVLLKPAERPQHVGISFSKNGDRVILLNHHVRASTRVSDIRVN